MDVRRISCMAAATFVGSLLIISATSPAHSQPPLVVQGHHYIDPETQRVVNYGDLDLANAPGQNRLVRRVAYAVNNLCDGDRSWSTLRVNVDRRGCSTAAWGSANPQIAAAIERAKSGTFVAAAALTIATAE